MNNSYGHNLVTSIKDVGRKNKPEIWVRKVESAPSRLGTMYALIRGPFWPPCIRNDCGLNSLDDVTTNNWLCDQYDECLDAYEHYLLVRKYLSGTTLLQYFEHEKDVKVVELDNVKNFREFFEKNTSRLLALLCGRQEKILFSVTIGHRGFIGTSNKSLMLSQVKLFGKKITLADHVWVNYTNAWSVAEPLIGGRKVYVLGKVVKYKRKDGTTDYSIKASKVIRA